MTPHWETNIFNINENQDDNEISVYAKGTTREASNEQVSEVEKCWIASVIRNSYKLTLAEFSFVISVVP